MTTRPTRCLGRPRTGQTGILSQSARQAGVRDASTSGSGQKIILQEGRLRGKIAKVKKRRPRVTFLGFSVPACPRFPSASSISPFLSVGRSRFFRQVPFDYPRLSRLALGPLGAVAKQYIRVPPACQARNSTGYTPCQRTQKPSNFAGIPRQSHESRARFTGTCSASGPPLPLTRASD